MSVPLDIRDPLFALVCARIIGTLPASDAFAAGRQLIAEAFGDGVVSHFQAKSGHTPPYAWAQIRGVLVAWINGVSEPDDVTALVLSSLEFLQPAFGGKVMDLQLTTAAEIASTINVTTPWFGQPALLVGHSFGGALAVLVGCNVLATFGASAAQILSFGAPKCGDADFVAAQGSLDVVRYMVEGDAVTVLPPRVEQIGWAAGLFSDSILEEWDKYRPMDGGLLLKPDGSISPSVQPGLYGTNLTAELVAYVRGDPVTVMSEHLIGYYAACLQQAAKFPFPPNIGISHTQEDPVPNNYVVNLFFEQGKAGWSETWYTRQNNIAAAYTDATNLAKARAQLLGQTTQLVEARVSDVTVFRDSEVSIQQLPAGFFTPKTISDNPFSALLLRLEAGAQYRRQLYLRGLPLGVSSTATSPVPPIVGFFNAALNVFFNYVLGASKASTGLAVRVQSKDPPNQLWPIQAITPVATGYLLTFPGPLTFPNPPVGATMQVYNIREFPALAGKFLVTAVAPLQVTIMAPNPQAFVYKGKSSARIVGVAFNQITNIFAERIVTRHVGRPFDTPVGRRKRRQRVGI